jgi:hypothetical protein
MEEEEEENKLYNIKHEFFLKKISFTCHCYKACGHGLLHNAIHRNRRSTPFVAIPSNIRLFDLVRSTLSIHQRPSITIHPRRHAVFFKSSVLCTYISNTVFFKSNIRILQDHI